jgi:hypothetical protein
MVGGLHRPKNPCASKHHGVLGQSRLACGLMLTKSQTTEEPRELSAAFHERRPAGIGDASTLSPASHRGGQ